MDAQREPLTGSNLHRPGRPAVTTAYGVALGFAEEQGRTTYLTLRKTGVPNNDSLRGNQEIEVIAIR